MLNIVGAGLPAPNLILSEELKFLTKRSIILKEEFEKRRSILIYVYRGGLMLSAMIIGFVLSKVHLPIPYLMAGIMISVFCKCFVKDDRLSWPKLYREYALYIAGYGIGVKFTDDTLHKIIDQVLGIGLSNVLMLMICLVLSYLTFRWTHEDYKSCILGILPGGLTMSMLMAEEDDSYNPNIIMVMQVIRLFGVLFTVPILVIMLFDAHAQEAGMLAAGVGHIPWYALLVLSPVGYYVAKALHLPTPRLLGPILAAAVASVLGGGVQAPPGILLMMTQASIGLFIGTQLEPYRLAKAKCCLPCVFLGVAFMLLISAGMAEFLAGYYHFDIITAFLALAPGGAAEMALAGLSMGADVSIIVAYQLARLVMVNVTVPPLIHYLVKHKLA